MYAPVKQHDIMNVISLRCLAVIVDLKICHTILQFPDCDDDNAISVSCLDLCYSVKARVLKDEKKDETAPVVLLEILEEDKKDCITEKGD